MKVGGSGGARSADGTECARAAVGLALAKSTLANFPFDPEA